VPFCFWKKEKGGVRVVYLIDLLDILRESPFFVEVGKRELLHHISEVCDVDYDCVGEVFVCR